MSPQFGQVALGVYALLLALGGIMGYVKAGSRPSLIAGVVSGLVALAALAATLMMPDSRVGFLIGLALAAALTVVFLRRFAATRKVMPAGVLVVVSVLMIGVLIAVLY